MSKKLEEKNNYIDKCGPTHIGYYPDGINKHFEYYYVNDLPHKEDGPAHIVYYRNGIVKSEIYYLNGIITRDNNLPSYTTYYENGNKNFCMYHVNGLIHRTDGPAHILYCHNGIKNTKEYYFLNDVQYFPKSLEEFKKFVKLLMFR